MSTATHENGTVATLDELPLMLTVEEAARVLRMGRNSAYAAVADGSIPSVRFGRVIRVPRQALAALCDGHSAVGAPAPAPACTRT